MQTALIVTGLVMVGGGVFFRSLFRQLVRIVPTARAECAAAFAGQSDQTRPIAQPALTTMRTGPEMRRDGSVDTAFVISDDALKGSR